MGLAKQERGSRSMLILNSGFAKSRSYLDLIEIFYTAEIAGCTVNLKTSAHVTDVLE